MKGWQPDFAAALLDAARPAPETLRDPQGHPAGARFSVYRNNVVVSLSEALSTAFPLVRKLLGAATFDRLAGVYVRAFPPKSPLMMFYGADLPVFLDTFDPLRHIGYLPDCARLDLAMREAYHAADAPALDPSVFTTPEANPEHLQLRLAPSSRIIRSAWPLFDIWRFNSVDGAPKPRAVAQDVLVTRPNLDPAPHDLPPGCAEWLDLMQSGMSFGAACDTATSKLADFDLQESLLLVLGAQALTHTTTKET